MYKNHGMQEICNVAAFKEWINKCNSKIVIKFGTYTRRLTQLRTHEGKQAFCERKMQFVTAFDLFKWFKDIK